MGNLTNNLSVYGVSTPSIVLTIEEGPSLAELAPVDLRLHTIAADVDDINGTKVTEWASSYGDQDDDALRGVLVLDLGTAAVAALRGHPDDLFAYDVQVTRIADSHIWYAVTRSTLKTCPAVTDG